MKIIMASPEEMKRYAPLEWLKKDIEIPVDEEDRVPWTIREIVGIGVCNPTAATMTMGIDHGVPIEKVLTEEEKETRRIENKGW